MNYKVNRLIPVDIKYIFFKMAGEKYIAKASSLVRTMMDSGLNVRQINIQKYLWVLFHVNISMATADGSLWKDGENMELISNPNTRSSTAFNWVV